MMTPKRRFLSLIFIFSVLRCNLFLLTVSNGDEPQDKALATYVNYRTCWVEGAWVQKCLVFVFFCYSRKGLQSRDYYIRGYTYLKAIAMPQENQTQRLEIFAGREVRIVKNCDRGLERLHCFLLRPRSQFFTIRTDPKPVNNLFPFFFFAPLISQTQGQNLTKALPWSVGRYRRNLPALTTNQNAGFVTVPSEKKIKRFNVSQPLDINLSQYNPVFKAYSGQNGGGVFHKQLVKVRLIPHSHQS